MPSVSFDIADSNDDGEVDAVSATYPPAAGTSVDTGSSFAGAGRSFSTPNYTVSNIVFRWDTSSIPDGATITAARLRIQVVGNSSTDGLSAGMGWMADPGTIGTEDWTNSFLSNAYAIGEINSMTQTVQTWELSNASGNVNKTGYTALYGTISSATPTADNYFLLDCLGSATTPRLTVDYVVSAADDPPIGFSGRGAGW